jgi:hypothetical protein
MDTMADLIIDELKSRIAALEAENAELKRQMKETCECWQQDTDRTERAEAVIAKLRLRFGEHIEASAGDRHHTWMDALRYLDDLARHTGGEDDIDLAKKAILNPDSPLNLGGKRWAR